MQFVSRAGLKLDHAIEKFGIDLRDKTCADLGCSTGGFVDCLLQRGARKVYAVDTGYGVLDWKLRKDPRVIVFERSNAMHVNLPEAADIITIDVAWTKQRNILPSAARLLADGGAVISLIKPHYEAPPAQLRRGVLPDALAPKILQTVELDIRAAGFEVVQIVASPIRGSRGNSEFLSHLIFPKHRPTRDLQSTEATL
jgi:23S rRNA (cytidine1920-2'-O)/16S rRNA (cytidine1409-2'-O)-methyltransferase